MKLSDIQKHWDVDCKIDWADAGKPSLRIPEIHNKYLKLHTESRLKFRSMERELKVLIKFKHDYYNGDLNEPELLKEYGLEPMQKKIRKPEIERYVYADDDVTAILAKVEHLEEKLKYLEQVLRQISNFSFAISNFIKWEQMTNPG